MDHRKLLAGIACHLHERNANCIERRDNGKRAGSSKHVEPARLPLNLYFQIYIGKGRNLGVWILRDTDQQRVFLTSCRDQVDQLLRISALTDQHQNILTLQDPQSAVNGV